MRVRKIAELVTVNLITVGLLIVVSSVIRFETTRTLTRNGYITSHSLKLQL